MRSWGFCAIGVIGLSAALAACGGPKPGGQTLAVVDGQPITQSQLNVDTVGIPMATQKDRAAALESLINRRLLVAAAKDQGLDKDANYQLEVERQSEILLAKRLLAQGTSGITASVTDPQISRYLADHPQYADQRKMIDVDQIQFAMPNDKQILNQMQKTRTLQELIAVLERAGIKSELSHARLDSAAMPQEMYAGLMKSLNGEPLVLANGGRTLAQVATTLTDEPLASDKAKLLGRRAVENEVAEKRFKQQITALRGAAKIDYAPEFKPGVK